ncbi:MAG: methyltransferase domain-containing protein [Planctomycetota bacterium]
MKENGIFPIRGKILGVTGISNFDSIIDIDHSEITATEYPKIDIQKLPYPEDSFDYVISDQVLEHVESPTKAVEESFRVLKKSGVAIHTTCFVNYLHPCPKDFWRLSPDALLSLCKNFSDILNCEGWGNRIAILLCFISNKFRAMQIPESKWSIKNLIANMKEENYPIVTWVVTRK